jgi:hypothetical protein
MIPSGASNPQLGARVDGRGRARSIDAIEAADFPGADAALTRLL